MKKLMMKLSAGFVALALAAPVVFGAGSEFYDHTTYPSQGSAGSSSAMRAELDLIEAGFGKLPDLAGNGGKITAINSGGTAIEAITTTGTGSGVRATSPTLVTPNLGTPSTLVGTNITGLPLTTGVTGTLPVANGGTGVTSSTGTGSVVLNSGPTLVAPVLGTPASGVATNLTGLPLTTGVTGTLPVANGGTGIATTTAYSPVFSGTTATGAFQATLGPGTAGQVLTSAGAGAVPNWSAPVVPGYITGLTLANNAGDATNDIDIATGAATDSTNVITLTLGSAITKRLDAAWAAGTGNGGLDTGAIANTTYHIWLIRKDSDGSIDALFSTSASAPTMPGGYTYKANIGAIIRSGGAILAFTQVGNEVLWKASALDFDSGANTTASTITVRAPLGIQTDALVQVIYNNSVAGNFVLYVSSPDQNDETASLAAARATVVNPSTTAFGAATLSVRTNTSAQIRIRSDDANNTTRISTRGFAYIRR